MLLLAVLGLVIAGAVLGGAGMRRLGRWASRAAGRWRPGAGVGAVVLAFAGLALCARGLFLIGLPLIGIAGVFAVAARRRAGPAPVNSPAMSEAEARAMLGVPPNATRKEIQAAYVRLMQRVHPDHGGASGLASQLNAARKRLLG